MSAETKYQEITKQMNDDIEQAIRAACDKIHSEIIPFINDDTEHNAVYRASDIVNSIIRGNFSLDGDTIICDGWKTRLTSCDYDSLVDKLAKVAGDKAKDMKIERLERQLSEAISGIYN
jgi:hypothetical protein